MNDSHKQCWVKEMRHNKVYIEWFYLYIVQKQVELIYACESQDNDYSLVHCSVLLVISLS